MEFGPFPKRDIEEISSILDKLKVHFEIVMREEMLAVQEKALVSNFLHSNTYRTQSFDPAFYFLIVDDGDLSVIGESLQKFGISTREKSQARGKGDEYVCPRCSYVSEAVGTCPRGHGQLLSYSVFSRMKRLRLERILRFISVIVLIIGAGMTIVSFLMENKIIP